MASPFSRANSSMRSCSTWSCSPSAAVRAVKAISLRRGGEKSAGRRGCPRERRELPEDCLRNPVGTSTTKFERGKSNGFRRGFCIKPICRSTLKKGYVLRFRHGSIAIVTISRGMNVHKSYSYFGVNRRGYGCLTIANWDTRKCWIKASKWWTDTIKWMNNSPQIQPWIQDLTT